jgi:TetR/AcrR family transcriptional regulator, regulator of autoinduction and epiphytic fitness
VVDAAFALILEGKALPSADDVADRANVSVSSVFRNFDGLADMHVQALDQFRSRYSHFVTARPAPGADLESRVGFFVRHRVRLYDQAGPLLMLARMRALDHEAMLEAVAHNRAALAAQTRECFGPEITGRTTADAADLASLLDSLTSPESFDLMTRTHGRSTRQIARAWRSGLQGLIAGWSPSRPTETRKEDHP